MAEWQEIKGKHLIKNYLTKKHHTIHIIILTLITSPLRGSITLSFLSLQVVAMRDPSKLHDILNKESGWKSNCNTASPLKIFQITIRVSKLAEARTPSAVGCQAIIPTFF